MSSGPNPLSSVPEDDVGGSVMDYVSQTAMEQAALPEIGAISQAEIGAISQTEIGAISQNAMEDDCWKSTAVVDRDMMEERVERVSWINFPDGVPYGERLLVAAEKGCTKLVEEIAYQHPDAVNHKDSDGYTPLHRACYEGWEDIVDTLLHHGADVGSRTEDAWTPLHSAARWNKTGCAKRLLAEPGCDVNALSVGKQTPLHIASSSQACAGVIQLLLWHPDTDTSLLNNSGDTAEKIALSSSSLGHLFEIKHKFVDINPLTDLKTLR